MVESLLRLQMGLAPDHEEYRRAYLTCFISLLTLAVSFFFVLYNSIYIYYLPLVFIDGSAVLISLLCLYLLLMKGKLQIAALLLVVALFVLSYLYIADVGHQEYALVYSFILPVLAIFLLGLLAGSLVSLIYFVLLVYLCVSNLDQWEPASYSVDSFINVVVLYGIFFALACYFESSRRKASEMLSEINRKLELQASTDALTAIFNRRYIEDRLIATSNLAYFAMADIDDFKQINDEYGHIAGDEVLQQVAEIMKNTMGAQSIVARWGGEEFAILFDNDNESQFLELIEKMRQAIVAHDFSLPRKVSISVGCALHYRGQHKKTLRRVDEALYQAKSAGKNCVRINL
ncbi:GGDEF domain-containing protein [Neptunicella sp. SCSIO 80796]|uniref:GGDEF domain-containing protein n=1 Tax=Neptunicella plasticusilytica TaxID=3117012 RepID=UPI003A4D9236